MAGSLFDLAPLLARLRPIASGLGGGGGGMTLTLALYLILTLTLDSLSNIKLHAGRFLYKLQLPKHQLAHVLSLGEQTVIFLQKPAIH